MILSDAEPTQEQFQRCLMYLREVIVPQALEKHENLEFAIAKRLAQELAWRTDFARKLERCLAKRGGKK